VVLTFGVILPALVFCATFALGVIGLQKTAEPDGDPGATIEVIGHQWWWEVRYDDGTGNEVVTANEIHVPVGTPVELRLRTADVIHSFWVPELMPKTDLLPDRINRTWLTADEPGTYRGQCAEYCGLQHAHMAFSVVAEPRADYEKWLTEQAADADAPLGEEEQRGLEVFTSTACATCHTIRGTGADGDVGPDLTHVGSRDRIAAGALPNDTGHMAGWVANSQTVKPGNLMPPQRLSPDDLRAVVAYLQSLE
jgi:cytochrome c oxidase subunit 2